GASPPAMGLRMQMWVPDPQERASVRGRLYFAQSADGKRLLYRITGKEGKQLSNGVAEVDKAVPTGWMNLSFRVAEWLPAAIQREDPRYLPKQPSENVPSALRLRFGGQNFWMAEATSAPLAVGDRTLELSFGRDRFALPFSLHLKNFTIDRNPGTDKAAGYKSLVVVKDPVKGDGAETLISMNEPLKYGGYIFYQASFQEREGLPPVSVFSVNYDPGRWVKYLGCLTMVFGILLMFYMNPHYWGILFGRGRKA
ncbi:cytochrome c biogenesis protein ResB, partial [bacterium]|nr:cytochrome c biogenesis protein ResB [bacterium]